MCLTQFWTEWVRVFRDASIRRLKPSPCKLSWANSLRTHFPERGWKLRDLLGHSSFWFDFTNPLPRKGMETLLSRVRRSLTHLYEPTSPKGDGNSYTAIHYGEQARLYEPTSPKGDGNFQSKNQSILRFLQSFTNPLPRKGMETFSPTWKVQPCTLRTHFPERGWKLYNNLTIFPAQRLFTNPLPRKGMETLHLHCSHNYRKPLRTHFPERGWKRCTEPRALQFIQLITNCRSLFKNPVFKN